MKKFRISRSAAPSVFTTLNMVFGFLCIIYASKGEFIHASLFIIFAAIADSLDGVVARLTNSSSKFGVELDSLADVISFGVAPSALVYYVSFYRYDFWGIILSILPMVFGAIRLARFNVQLVGFDKDYFTGIPIPSQAMTICAYILLFYDNGLTPVYNDYLIFIVVTVSLLMVSTFKYDTLPKFTLKDIKRKPIRFSVFIIGLIIMIITKGKAVFPFFVFYIITGIIRSAIRLLKKVNRQNKKIEILEK